MSALRERPAGGDPFFTVVVPTFNRLDVLPEVLAALGDQREAPTFEVVVVDDGSSDGTPAWIDSFRPAFPFRSLRQENRGPAAARNAGVAIARGLRVAFLGDDTVPSPGWLAAHAAAWQRRGADPAVTVLGRTDWHRRMRRTPFLEHINENGLQFGFALISDPERVPFNFFYTSNISLGRDRLLAEPFDTAFPYAAWEDIEVSYRLDRRGQRMVYAPEARVAHDHPTSFHRFTIRQERAGYCAVVFYRLHPELGPFLGLSPAGPPPLPSGALQWLREGVARALQRFPVNCPRLWEAALRYHYIRGLHRGWQDRVVGAGRKEISHGERQAAGSQEPKSSA
ncbi:MAG: glycosyltransferase family 2 protein [Holophagales bacterium]|nr:MAG: glycosyltransferase family 2 protein [Holophagales bacterium]